MSGSAIMMMVIGIVVIWGGLALSIANLFKKRHKLKHLYRNGTDVLMKIVLEKIE